MAESYPSTLADVLAGVAARHELAVQHKFVYELGWRAYFRHVWRQRGDGILRSLHEGPLPDATYATELPADIRQGCTGVPAIDEAVRTLHATGMLHNHAQRRQRGPRRARVMAQPGQRDRPVLRGAGPPGAEDPRCCGIGTCIIDAEGRCWCGQ